MQPCRTVWRDPVRASVPARGYLRNGCGDRGVPLPLRLEFRLQRSTGVRTVAGERARHARRRPRDRAGRTSILHCDVVPTRAIGPRGSSSSTDKCVRRLHDRPREHRMRRLRTWSFWKVLLVAGSWVVVSILMTVTWTAFWIHRELAELSASG